MSLEANLSSHKYAIAIPAYDGKVCAETTTSLLDVVGNLAYHGISSKCRIVRSGALIDQVRNQIADWFLNETDADTLICIDSDMVFDWNTMQRLLVYSSHYPLVAGAYNSKQEPPKFIVTVSTTVPAENGLVPVDSLGFGFVAIKREVFEGMKNVVESYKDEQKTLHAFFRLDLTNGVYRGEDIYFFDKAREAGFQAYVDPMIELGHVGIKVYNTPFKAVCKSNP